VIGVSADDLATEKRFCEQTAAPFPMVGDPEGKILDSFGVRWPVVGLARRATFVLDKAGVVRQRIVSEVLIRRHIEQALEALQSIAGPSPAKAP
jgi:peroxiredoxin